MRRAEEAYEILSQSETVNPMVLRCEAAQVLVGPSTRTVLPSSGRGKCEKENAPVRLRLADMEPEPLLPDRVEAVADDAGAAGCERVLDTSFLDLSRERKARRFRQWTERGTNRKILRPKEMTQKAV